MYTINYLIDAATKYDGLIEAGIKPENIYIRTRGNSLSFEPHTYGILNRMHRWIYKEEYEFQNSAQQLADLFYKSLRDSNEEQLKISEKTLSQLANLSAWLDVRIDRYEKKSHNLDKERIKNLKSTEIIKKFMEAWGETGQKLTISDCFRQVMKLSFNQRQIQQLEQAKAQLRKIQGEFDYISVIIQNCYPANEVYSNLKSQIVAITERVKNCPYRKQADVDSVTTQLSKITTLSKDLQAIVQAYREEEEKEKVRIYGRTTVLFRETNEIREIFIREKKLGGTTAFYAYDPKFQKNEGIIGKIFVEILSEGAPSALVKRTQQSFPIVYGHWVESGTGLYKRVGTKLMQVAIEYGYPQGCQGKFVGIALTEAQIFHYRKIKLRSINKRENESLEHDHPIDHPIDMYLTPEAIKEWRAEIKEHPILDATKEKHVMDLLSAP